ncbi:MAG: hypothetical protein R2787_12640 [Saprospiraceae bacterium]
MSRLRFLMWSAILFLPACGMAGTVDSLLHQLQQRALDTHRIVILHALTDQLSDTNPDSAYLYCWQAFQLSQDLNWIRGKAESTYRLGLLYRDRGENDQAIEQLYTSADLFARIPDAAGQPPVCGGSGTSIPIVVIIPKPPMSINRRCALRCRKRPGGYRQDPFRNDRTLPIARPV